MAFTTDDRIWAIPLDRYERDNLVSLLTAVMRGDGESSNYSNPLGAANNGDWVGQLLYKLQRRDNAYYFEEGDVPNRIPSEMVKDARNRAKAIR